MEENKLLEVLAQAESEGATNKQLKQIRQMMGMAGADDKRGITKAPFSKSKRKTKNKMQKASRKANRGK